LFEAFNEIMKQLILYGIIIFLFNGLTSCNGQSNSKEQNPPSTSAQGIVGGGCEGCELMYVDMPKDILSGHTSLGWTEETQKLLLTGKVFQLDGRTPAPNVIIYYWHTDSKGLYSSNKETPTKAKRHGKLRGWVKSDDDGNYTIKTSRPAAYPNEDIPQHIHLSIKEPYIQNEYYADLYFDDDPLYLNHKKKYGKFDRAGTEILRVLLDDNVQVAEHDIVVGLNIPNYPAKTITNKLSGLNIGEDQPSFIPHHAYGPDKGTQTCPVCKYGRYHGVVYFVGNNPNWQAIKQWLQFLEQESTLRQNYLKAYFVYGNDKAYNKEARQRELEKVGQELNIKNTALTFVPSFKDMGTEANLNNINPEVENTFIVYKHRTIVDKYVNLDPTPENFNRLTETLNRTKGNYFKLPEPKHD
jgi:protocatechuate 3,4-dioxygenase, beta subunit